MKPKRMTKTYELDGRPMRSWYLAGSAGVAEFTIRSGPFLSAVVIDGEKWIGMALGLHTPGPQRDGHEPQEDACTLMDGVPCYFEFSATAAGRLLREWADTGDEATVWSALECEYAGAERLASAAVGR